MLREPKDERRIGVANERGGPFDGRLFSRGGIREAERLLEVAKANLNGPTFAVGFQDFDHRLGGVRAEENPKADATSVDPDHDYANQAGSTSPVPLGIDHLKLYGAALAVQKGGGTAPGRALIARQLLWLRQQPAPDPAPSGPSLLTFRGWRGQYGIRPHGPEQGHGRR